MEAEVQYWRNKALDFVTGVGIIDDDMDVSAYRESIVTHFAKLADAHDYFLTRKVDENAEIILVSSIEKFKDEYTDTSFLGTMPDLLDAYHGLKAPSRFHFLNGHKMIIRLPLVEGYFHGAIFLAWQKEFPISQAFYDFLKIALTRIKEAIKLNSSFRNLEELRVKFYAVFRSVSQGLIFTDESGKDTWLNPKAKEILGLEMEGEEIEPALVSASMQRLREKADNADEILASASVLFRNPEKEYRNWLWKFPNQVFSVFTTPTISKNVNGRLWVFEDITEIYFANQMLNWYNKQLEEVNQEIKATLEQVSAQNELIASKNTEISAKNANLEKLNQEKDNLISIVSHDLRTPLFQIQGFLKLMETESSVLTDNQRFAIGKMHTITSQGLQLIKEILDLSTIGQNQVPVLSPLNLNVWFQEEVKGYTIMAEKKDISIHFECLLENAVINVEKKNFNRIMDNLISNAIKFSPSHTQVQVTASKTGRTIRIAVQDQGQGITEVDKKYLFQKFRKLTARPTAGESSTGLGLSIVKKLVEDMGGTIHCESEWGKGATFIVGFLS